jgi:hypothetical protein
LYTHDTSHQAKSVLIIYNKHCGTLLMFWSGKKILKYTLIN